MPRHALKAEHEIRCMLSESIFKCVCMSECVCVLMRRGKNRLIEAAGERHKTNLTISIFEDDFVVLKEQL